MKHTIIAWMRDKPGVLNRVAGLLRRRNFNIDSLQVGASETPGISRMTFVLDGSDRQVDQAVKQVRKLVDITHVEPITSQSSILHELAMMRVHTNSETRSEIVQIVHLKQGEVVDVAIDSMVVQVVGEAERIDSLIGLLENFGISELVRTGPVAMAKATTNSRLAQSITGWRARSNGRQVSEAERMRTGGV
jgi:acetolactate synthase-1/3 small subunit